MPTGRPLLCGHRPPTIRLGSCSVGRSALSRVSSYRQPKELKPHRISLQPPVAPIGHSCVCLAAAGDTPSTPGASGGRPNPAGHPAGNHHDAHPQPQPQKSGLQAVGAVPNVREQVPPGHRRTGRGRRTATTLLTAAEGGAADNTSSTAGPQPAKRRPPERSRGRVNTGVGPELRCAEHDPPASPPVNLRPSRQQQSQQAADELRCSHFGSCSGCSLSSGLAAPPLYMEAVEFFRGYGLQHLPAVLQRAHGWRCRAKLAVRGSAGSPRIGLFREGSHEVEDIVASSPAAAAAVAAAPGRKRQASGGGGSQQGTGCVVQHPRINEAAALIKQVMVQMRLQPYNEPGGGPAARKAKRQQLQQQAQPTAMPAMAAAAAAQQQQQQPHEADGLLRYLQLTAVPSSSGGRAEEDPVAAVQVVLVLAADAQRAEADPRVGRILQLCRVLWQLAGPGTLMQPTHDTAASPPASATAPSPRMAPHASAKLSKPASSGRSAQRAAPQPLIHSIWLNFQPDSCSNVVLGPDWRHVAGPAQAWQDFGGAPVCIGPGSFVQANYGAMQLVLQEIAAAVPKGSRVTELHAGVGVIGLSLAAGRQIRGLRLVEVNPHAAQPFARSLERLRASGLGAGVQLPQDVEYVTAAAGSTPGAFLAGSHVVVADPPRKGLEPALLQELVDIGRWPSIACTDAVAPAAAAAAAPAGVTTPALARAQQKTPLTEPLTGGEATDGGTLVRQGDGSAAPALQRPHTLVYLSCGFRALQSDLAALLRPGSRWRLVSATAYMFFPGTDSIEMLVVLTRDKD